MYNNCWEHIRVGVIARVPRFHTEFVLAENCTLFFSIGLSKKFATNVLVSYTKSAVIKWPSS